MTLQNWLRHTFTFVVLLLPLAGVAQNVVTDSLTLALPAPAEAPDSLIQEDIFVDDALPQYAADTLRLDDLVLNEDSLAAVFAARMEYERRDLYFERFNPKPAKAVWMALLIPGGGQIYNRKYWKLPIIYGGFLGLVYGYNWNQRYYRTYSNAYREIMSDSPNPSYLNLLRGGTLEQRQQYAAAHRDYLTNTFQRKKNIYRNYRDYCVVGMLAVYLVSVVDAYVDAALYHFDVTPELSADNSPAFMLNYSFEF